MTYREIFDDLHPMVEAIIDQDEYEFIYKDYLFVWCAIIGSLEEGDWFEAYIFAKRIGKKEDPFEILYNCVDWDSDDVIGTGEITDELIGHFDLAKVFKGE